jgi:hypothetical protein
MIVNALWAGAAAMLIIGFVLRPLARFLGGPDLRLTSVIVIAGGLVLAGAGWVGEKIAARRPS